MLAFANRLTDIRFVRYFLASVGALAVDVACFLVLLGLGVWPAAAATAGYSLGIVAHWLMSSRAVFLDGVAVRGARRTRQKALFVGTAFAGVALTTAVVGFGDLAGLDPRLAKLAAIGASFTLNWQVRSKVVFRALA